MIKDFDKDNVVKELTMLQMQSLPSPFARWKALFYIIWGGLINRRSCLLSMLFRHAFLLFLTIFLEYSGQIYGDIIIDLDIIGTLWKVVLMKYWFSCKIPVHDCDNIWPWADVLLNMWQDLSFGWGMVMIINISILLIFIVLSVLLYCLQTIKQ